jgi:pimeloyl-ACP methyl ester carboxylesterase
VRYSYQQTANNLQRYGTGVKLAVFLFVLFLLAGCVHDTATVERIATTENPWSKWCTVKNDLVHYIDTRTPNPRCSLLIVHGYLGSTLPFSDLIAAVAQDIRVVIPDLPAFGASDVPDSTCTMEFYLDFLKGFSEQLGLDQFYLLGTSVGVNIAVHYTIEQPEQIQGLIFLSPFGLNDQGGRMTQIDRWDTLLPLAVNLITKRGLEKRLRQTIVRQEKITEDLVEAYWKPFTTQDGRRAVVDITRNIIGRCSMDEYLPRIEQPVLILIGSEDTLISPEDRRRFGELLVDEHLEIIEECGHFLYLESPDVVSELIVQFTMGG